MESNKQYLTIGGIVIGVLVLVGVIGFLLKNDKSKSSLTAPSPTETVLPTVDSSVTVDLTATSDGREVTLAIAKIPSATTSIDYELSYQTAKQSLQGVIGTITLNGEADYQKKITLGTCSSGKCVYHQVVGKIKLTMKFSGGYGEKIFEKEYTIN